MKPFIKNVILFTSVFVLGILLRSIITDFFNPTSKFFIMEDAIKDFGKIQKNKPVKHFFKFMNTGNTSLKIKNVETNCGCTASAWPKKSIKPNQSDSILVEYDSNIVGSFNRKAIVYIEGTTETNTLFIKGIITD